MTRRLTTNQVPKRNQIIMGYNNQSSSMQRADNDPEMSMASSMMIAP